MKKWQNFLVADRLLPKLVWILTAISIATGVVILASVWWLLSRMQTELFPLLGQTPELEQSLHRVWWIMLVVDGISAVILLTLAWFIFQTMYSQVKALAESRARNRAIVDNMVDGVVHIDARGNIVAVNKAAEVIFGHNLEDIQGKRMSMLFSEPYRQEYERDIDSIQDTGGKLNTGARQQVKGLRKDGTVFPMHLAISAAEVGGITMYTAIVRNMTEHHKAMAELERARDAAQAADLAKSQFLANMSHEIRTPMNGVMGMLDLLKETELTTDQCEFADTAQRSGQALLSIINDILDFSKIEAGKLTIEEIDFDLWDNVEEVTSLLAKSAHAKGLEMASYIASGVPAMVRGDPHRLRQILINLMGNAVKFTEQGEVIVTVDLEQDRESDLLLRFEVSDTGIGIDETIQQRLFQPFSQADASTTRRHGGTGLGLAICKRLVALMGGEIEVTSKPGEGSCFRFIIDLKKSLRIHPLPKTSLHNLRVLIVDDNKANRTILERYLRNWGMLPHGVEDGYQALDLLREAHRHGESFEIGILDMQMPFMDGLELAKHIKADPDIAAVRLMMLSSYGYSNQDYKSVGIEASLVKPVRQALLHDTLIGILKGNSGEESEPGTNLAPRLAQPRFYGRVLLVEDNLTNQRVVQKMLETLGVTSTVAPNGAEAVAAIKQQSYDLVLMDVQMPVMDGLRATQLIREQEPEGNRVPIMAMTASAMKGDQERCMAVGMDDYLAKPINKKVLAEKLTRWLPLDTIKQ